MILPRLTLACVVAFVLGCTCTDQNMIEGVDPSPAPEGLGQRAYNHVSTLVSYGPRHTGSTGWRRGLDHIFKTLMQMGLTPRRDTWTDPVENITFTNITVILQGESKDKIVLGCHHDTKKCSGHADPEQNFYFVGANDSGSGVGLLLELARALKDRTRRATYEFVFFDGEESLTWAWDIDRALFGSRRYVRKYVQARLDDPQSPEIKAFILLDMVGSVDLHIDEETNSDQELRDIVRAAALATGHQDYFFEHSLGVTDDHIPFLDEGIRCIDLIDLEDNPQWHTADDTLQHISAKSLHIVGEVVLTALPVIETRFFGAAKHQ